MTRKKQLKKLVICILCVICTLVTFTPVNAYATTKVTLSNTKITLRLGNTKVLKLKNAKGKVTWKTSNAKVVSIKKKDATSITLTPKKQGNVTITATNNKKTYTCKVNVPKAKHIKWEDETVLLGRANTIPFENVYTPIQWSIDNKKIASIKSSGKNNTKLTITSLTHGETMVHAIIDGTIYDMKVIVPEVKLDVAKIYMDETDYYIDIFGMPKHCSIRSYYDEKGNDITNDLGTTCEYYDYNNRTFGWDDPSKGTLIGRYRKDADDVMFIGTNISMWDVKWESSNPEKLTIPKSGGYYFHGYPTGKGCVTLTTKLGNETFSFVVEYDMCDLPYDESMF